VDKTTARILNALRPEGTPPVDRVLYYPYWITATGGHRHPATCWGEPCDTLREAEALVRSRVESGLAVWGTVVEFSGGVKRPLPNKVWPKAARNSVLHWEQLMDLTEPPA
jgi:hypothetical protein